MNRTVPRPRALRRFPSALLLLAGLAAGVPAAAQSVVAPEAGRLLGDGFAHDVVLFFRAPQQTEPLLPAATASLETDGRGASAYTLNGRRASAAEMAAHADSSRLRLRALSVERREREAQRQAGVLARAGLVGRLVARSGRLAQVRLTAPELDRLLAAAGDELVAVDVLHPTREALTDALTTNAQGALEILRVIPFAHAYGLQGAGVGIWLQEANSPDPADSEIDTDRLVYLTPEGPGEHATLTTTLAQKTAPQATVYYGHQPVPCHTWEAVLDEDDPPVYLGSHSWNWGDTTTGTYGNCAAEWDDYVYETRLAMFVPSGGNTMGAYTTTPGKAFNVFATGGADTDLMDIPEYSGVLDPETGAIKPDGVTPGSDITRGPGIPAASGVSVATPLAAGFAANMLGGSAFFRYQPQAIKAYLAAGATTDVVPGGIAEDGPGMLNFLHTWFFRSGTWWNGGNGAYFHPATQDIVQTHTLTGGRRYRVAISWLVPGAYALANKKPSQEMKLTVSKGRWSRTSSYPGSTLQWVDFVAPETGPYTVRIQRTFNGGGDVALALTVGEVVPE